MAIQDKTLSSAEHDWFATRSGQPKDAPLTQHKRAYFNSVLPAAAKTTNNLLVLEKLWIRHTSGVSHQGLPELWAAMVQLISGTPSTSIDENKFLFYSANQDVN